MVADATSLGTFPVRSDGDLKKLEMSLLIPWGLVTLEDPLQLKILYNIMVLCFVIFQYKY